MPELPEVRIMSDFINQSSKNINFKTFYKVEKNNSQSEPYDLIENFNITAIPYGKTMYVHLHNDHQYVPIYVFMGMSGNWDWVETNKWETSSKYIRLRIESDEGHSLILFGGYMGPKWSLAPFASKRGYDPTTEFDDFKRTILKNLSKPVFDSPICEVLLNQEYFNGIGNYLRSTILYYAGVNPFESARHIIKSTPTILELCAEIPLIAYELNGGQLRDWKNPIDKDSTEFKNWVFYQKGLSCKDNMKRTFWFDPKWEMDCPYKINQKKKELVC